MRKESEVLEHHPHFFASESLQLLAFERLYVDAVYPHVPMGDVMEFVYRANGRRFTRTRQTHNDENFAFLDSKRHVAQPDNVSRLLLHIVFVHSRTGQIEGPPARLRPKDFENLFETNYFFGVWHCA